MNKTIRKGDFERLVMESSKEFKAVIGTGVENSNKSENDKTYKETKKKIKDFDGGGSEEYWKGKAKYEKADGNETTLGYEPENASKEYKDRIDAQAEGYTSKLENDNKIEKSGDFDGNKEIKKEIEKKESEKHKNKAKLKATGLTASKMPKSEFEKDELFEENYPTAWFKKTTFVNEEHMESRIPDEFKKEGYIFNMKDKTDNTYLCEWTNKHAKILKHSNVNGMNESLKRMHELMGYKTVDSKTNHTTRVNENEQMFSNTINRMREIIG